MWVPKLDFRWILLGSPPQLWVVFVGYPFKRRWQNVSIVTPTTFIALATFEETPQSNREHGWRQQNHRFSEAVSRVKEVEPPFLLSKAAEILAWPNWRCKGWKRKDFCSFDSFPGWRCHQDYQGTVFVAFGFWSKRGCEVGARSKPL